MADLERLTGCPVQVREGEIAIGEMSATRYGNTILLDIPSLHVTIGVSRHAVRFNLGESFGDGSAVTYYDLRTEDFDDGKLGRVVGSLDNTSEPRIDEYVRRDTNTREPRLITFTRVSALCFPSGVRFETETVTENTRVVIPGIGQVNFQDNGALDAITVERFLPEANGGIAVV